MRKFDLKKVMFWVGVAAAVVAPFMVPANESPGIAIAISALAFLKAAELVATKTI
jgi:hypothetical protein